MNWNKEQLKALDLIKSGENVYIYGPGGTGKSTIINYIKDSNTILLAPTGIAALNIGGVTICSFSNLGKDSIWLQETSIETIISNEKLVKLINSSTKLIVDEISMVSLQVMEKLNNFFKTIKKNRLPYGGIQAIVLGDPFQIPLIPYTPKNQILLSKKKALLGETYNKEQISSDYFEDSSLFDYTFRDNIIELKQNCRTENQNFSEILSILRIGHRNPKIDDALNNINDRIYPKPENCIEIVHTNIDNNKINKTKLDELRGEEKTFKNIENRKEYLENTNIIENSPNSLDRINSIDILIKSFNKDNKALQEPLVLKLGCKIMLINNISPELVNGMCGVVIEINDSIIQVKFDKHDHITDIHKHKFYTDDERLYITRFPLILAYSFTAHKVQGLTILSPIFIDPDKHKYTDGKTMYTILSRVTKIEHIFLKSKLFKYHFKPDIKRINWYESIKT